MRLEEVPGLPEGERRAVDAYEDAQFFQVPALMGTLLFGDESADRGARKAAREVCAAHEALAALAPAGVPGRDPSAPSYAELLRALRARGLGERDGILPSELSVPWGELPEARLLVFCAVDLMHYRFLTRGTRFGGLPAGGGFAGDGTLPLLFDLPEGEREALGEEGTVGAHADRLELETRLHRLLERASGDDEGARREKLWQIGYDCGNEALVFVERYGEDPSYADGFVEGCLERIREEADAGLTHPEDVTAEQFEGIWRDPNLSEEDRREFVVGPLAADCDAREDEGELWRL